jgi:hypothetical protein
MLDFLNHWAPKPWTGPVILESEKERVGAAERQSLRALYASSDVHV